MEAKSIRVTLSMAPSIRSQNVNVHFYQGNVITQLPREWTPTDSGTKLPQDMECFNHVFSRLLRLGMMDWPRYIRIMFDLLSPGGWAEVHDLDWADFDQD
jgi:hypothetical protein